MTRKNDFLGLPILGSMTRKKDLALLSEEDVKGERQTRHKMSCLRSNGIGSKTLLKDRMAHQAQARGGDSA